MRNADLHNTAEKYGFGINEVVAGFFLHPITRDRFGHRHIGDDVVLVKRDGEILLYEEDAQAYIAARAVAMTLMGDRS